MDSKGAKDLDFSISAKGIASPVGNYASESKTVEEYFPDDTKEMAEELARVDIISVALGADGDEEPLEAPIELKIVFELDRDVVAGYWSIKFLVDSCDARVVRGLGDTNMEDYIEGENDVYFTCDTLDFSGIAPSALTNSGLLIAVFLADGKGTCSSPTQST